MLLRALTAPNLALIPASAEPITEKKTRGKMAALRIPGVYLSALGGGEGQRGYRRRRRAATSSPSAPPSIQPSADWLSFAGRAEQWIPLPSARISTASPE